MKRKMTFFAFPTRRGAAGLVAALALLAPQAESPSNADKATAPKPHPAVRRNSRRDVIGVKLLQDIRR